MKKLLLALLLFVAPVWGGSIDFDGTGDYYTLATSLAEDGGGRPHVQHCWVNIDNASAYYTIFSDHTSGSSNHHEYTRSNITTPTITCRMRDNAGGASLVGAEVTAGTWSSVTCQFIGALSQKVNVDGTTNTSTHADVPSGRNETRIGNSGLVSDMNGKIAFCSTWTANLTDDQIGELNLGMWPTIVGTETIQSTYPLLNTGTQVNLVTPGTNNMTEAGNPAEDDSGPPVFFPMSGQ